MNPAAPFPTRRHWFWLAVALGMLYFGFLGTRGLNEPDEGRYANIALAMARPGGDWWEPRMSGYGHYDKPPLIYWATAVSFRAFGVNEWAARLPPLLGAVLTLLGLGWTAYRLRGAAVAWWAVLICGTSVQFWAFGRILSTDMLLTGWCTLAVAAWSEGRRQQLENRSTWGWWLASLTAWTLAWWTKATPALIPLAGLTFGVVLTGDRSGLRALKPLLLFPAIILLGSPWFLSMLHTYPELKTFFFGRELAGRLAGRIDGRHGSPFYYLPVSLVGWLPWWPLALWGLWRARIRRLQDSIRTSPPPWTTRLGVEGWIVLTGGVVLSLAASKLASYTLTLAPWAALLSSRPVAKMVEGRTVNWRLPLLWPFSGFFVVALAGAAILPRRLESHLKVNSSVREVSEFLRAQGAQRVDADHYWPGLEFYLDENVVRYVLSKDGAIRFDAPNAKQSLGLWQRFARIERYHERASDLGIPPDRFVEPNLWPRALPPVPDAPVGGGGWWFVRFHRQSKPRFDQSLAEDEVTLRPVKVKRIGDFDLYRVPEFHP